ncbi:Maf family protein [Thermanaerovibrio velox]|nr:Maf family protein [Thermanaerovibrio velox]
MRLILASGSPRRRELLAALGWNFQVVVSQVDESPLPGESPEDMVLRLSLAKARDVALRAPDALVIGADTVVELDGQIFGKPNGRDEGLRMLMALQGRTHRVHTGVSLVLGDRSVSGVETTRVLFRPLSAEDAACYINTGEGDDKAGSYAIQGKGAMLVESIEGCYFNVVGLPVLRLSRLLEEMGFSLSDQLGGVSL